MVNTILSVAIIEYRYFLAVHHIYKTILPRICYKWNVISSLDMPFGISHMLIGAIALQRNTNWLHVSYVFKL